MVTTTADRAHARLRELDGQWTSFSRVYDAMLAVLLEAERARDVVRAARALVRSADDYPAAPTMSVVHGARVHSLTAALAAFDEPEIAT